MMYLGEGNEGEYSHSSKHDGGYQHDHSRANISAEECDCSQPPTAWYQNNDTEIVQTFMSQRKWQI